MDKIELIFLLIIKNALKGKKTESLEALTVKEWQSLFILAEKHSILPMFYESVYSLPQLKKLDAPFIFAAKKKVMNQVLMQTVRTEEFLCLYKKLLSENIKPLVIKGITLRCLYPMPDHRPSSDEDVLIPQNSYSICHEILTSFGMQTESGEESREKTYEIPYRKNGSPLFIELHKHLFPPESEAYGDLNRFFENVFEENSFVNVNGVNVYTLNPTDNLFYLLCHAFKHFLHSGFGIRQVCDIVTYAEKYGENIDWLKVFDNCRAINALCFAASIFNIGEKYLGFDKEKARFSEEWEAVEVNEEDMLIDLLTGGLYGASDMSRKHSSNITLDAVVSTKKGKKKSNSVLLSLFPAREKLETRYSYLKSHPYLLPVAWTQRIIKYSKETREMKNNKASESLRIGSERVELLKKYKIIK